MTSEEKSTHASAVAVGERAVLIRGASGSGKSSLAFSLILAGRTGLLPKTVLVGDDRVRLNVRGTELVVSAVEQLGGQIEIRGLGIRRTAFLPDARVGLVVDLGAPDAERLPPEAALQTVISGIELPRIPVAIGHNPLPLVVAFLTTS
jgi:serine kinase of HPr protein (carbohydrate metabolism regulator)